MQKNLALVLFFSWATFSPAWAVHDDAGTEEGEETSAPTPVVESDRSVDCIQSICKPAKPVTFATQHLKKELTKLVARIKDGSVGYSPRFENLVRSVDEKVKAKNKLESELLGKPFNPKSKAIDGDINTLLNVSMMMAMSRPLLMNSQFKIDIPASRKSLLKAGYSEEIADWLLPAVDYFLTPEFVALSFQSRSLAPAQYLKQTYGSESEGAKQILTSYQAFLKDLRERKSNLATILEWQAHAPEAEAILARVEKGTPLSASDLLALPKVDVMVRSAQRALATGSPLRGDYQLPGTKEPQGFHFDLGMLVGKLGGPEGVVTRIAKQLADQQAATLRALEACKTNYLYQREIFPRPEEIKQLNASKDSAREKLKGKVLNGFSDETQKNLSDTLNKTVLYSPPSRQEAEERFGRALARAEASYASTIAFLENLKGSKAEDFRDALSALSTVQPISTSADSLCADVIMGDYSDAMVYQEGVRLGPALGFMDPSSQEAGIIHELAHAVSSRFREGSTVSNPSSAIYRKLKLCVTEMHPAKISPRFTEKAGGADFTTGELAEEDLADWISGKAVGKTKVNAWCHVMQSSEDGEGWAPASTTPEEGDHHSGNLFRLIHHEQLRGKKIGEACQAMLKKSHGAGKVKSCAM